MKLTVLPFRAGLALVVVAAVAACTGNKLPPCVGPAVPVFAMIDPSPGATDVSDNLGEIVVEGFGPNDLTLRGGSQTIALTLEPAPTPTPTPQDGVPQSIAAISAPLLASTTYTVTYPYTDNGKDCAPVSGTASLGSFTTK